MAISHKDTAARANRKERAGGIIPATRYTPIPKDASARRPYQTQIRIARRRESMVDWLHREFKAGNYLAEYLRREKGSGLSRRLALAEKYRNLEHNKKSDMRRRLVLPAREFMRLKMMDPHFFDDEQNVKNLIRDNPEIQPWRK